MTLLRSLLSDLQRFLVLELTPASQPSGLRYGRPHASARAVSHPRYSPTGEALPGATRIPGDCPKPIRGRCECAPDGSWRPVASTIQPTVVVDHLRDARETSAQPFALAGDFYVRLPDGRWECRFPYRRALDRLRGASMRRYLILSRLLDGLSLREAFDGLGEYSEDEALSIVRQALSYAESEMTTLWERKPRSGRPDSVGWVSMSEAQRSAVMEGEAA